MYYIVYCVDDESFTSETILKPISSLLGLTLVSIKIYIYLFVRSNGISIFYVHFWLTEIKYSKPNVILLTHLFPQQKILDLTLSHSQDEITAHCVFYFCQNIDWKPCPVGLIFSTGRGGPVGILPTWDLLRGAPTTLNPPLGRNIETGGWILEIRPPKEYPRFQSYVAFILSR